LQAKLRTQDFVPLHEVNVITEMLRYGTRCQGISQFYLYVFIHERNEACQPKLVLTYQGMEG